MADSKQLNADGNEPGSLPVHRDPYVPFTEQQLADHRHESMINTGIVIVLAVIAFLIVRAINRSARKVSVENVARTAGALTSAAERGFKQGRSGDR